MPPDVRITAEAPIQELDALMRRIPVKLKPLLVDQYKHASLSFLSFFKKTRLSGPPGIQGVGGRYSMFRRFEKEIKPPTSSTVLDSGFTIYTESPVAEDHEKGARVSGPIRDPEGTHVGVPLKSAQQMFDARGKLKRAKMYRQPQALPESRRRTVRINGRRYIFIMHDKKGRLGDNMGVFVYKRFIRIRRRLHFFQTFKQHMPRIQQILTKAVDKALRLV